MSRGRNGAAGRAGLSVLEVLVGATILALGILPVVQSMSDTGHEAGFSQGFLLAHVRVQALLDAQESLGFDRLSAVGPQEQALAIPGEAGDLPALPGARGGDLYRERLTAVQLADGLVAVRAEVCWTLAGDPERAARTHVARSFRLISRPDSSWILRVPLPLAPAPSAD